MAPERRNGYRPEMASIPRAARRPMPRAEFAEKKTCFVIGNRNNPLRIVRNKFDTSNFNILIEI